MDWNSKEARVYIPVIWTIIILPFGIIMFVSLTLNICIYSNVSRIESPLLKYYCILSCLSFIISNISELIYIIVAWNINKNAPIIINYAIGKISWSSGQVFLYLFFLKKLTLTFTNSAYQCPKSQILIFKLCIIIFFGLVLLQTSLVAIYYPTPKYTIFITIITLLTQMVDLILSICLIYLFTSKLFILCITQTECNVTRRCITNSATTSVSNKNDDSSYSISLLNDRQIELINIISKQNILSLFPIIITQLYLVLYVINDLSYYNNWDNKLFWTYLVTCLIKPLNCIINILCIYLSFKFKSKLYNKICYFCHKKLKQLCNNITQKRIINEYS